MKQYLLESIEKSRNYTLQVAEIMPPDQYDFRPVDTIWSFAELMHHIAYSIKWMEENYITGLKSAWNPTPIPAGKEKIIEYLEKMYAELKHTINRLQKLEEEAVNGSYATLEHVSHHRGQATTYLRSKGITPPEYPF